MVTSGFRISVKGWGWGWIWANVITLILALLHFRIYSVFLVLGVTVL